MSLTAVRRTCSDGMSDARYRDTVTLRWRGRTFKGCGGGRVGGVGAALLRAWRIASVGGRAVALPDAALTFTPTSVSGRAGCNTLRGAYRIEDDRLAAGPIMTTRMMCAPAAMRVERAVLSILSVPLRVRPRGERAAVLTNARGTIVLERR